MLADYVVIRLIIITVEYVCPVTVHCKQLSNRRRQSIGLRAFTIRKQTVDNSDVILNLRIPCYNAGIRNRSCRCTAVIGRPVVLCSGNVIPWRRRVYC